MSSSSTARKRTRSVSPAVVQKKSKPDDTSHLTSLFLSKLPAEIRNMIYKEFIGDFPRARFKINKCDLQNSHWHPVLKKSSYAIGRIRYAFLRSTNRQIRAEFISMFWESTDSHLCTCALSKQFPPALQWTGSRQQFSFLLTANLQRVTLQVHFGEHEFGRVSQFALLLETVQFSGSLVLVGSRYDVDRFKMGLVVICTSYHESTGSLLGVCKAVSGDAVFQRSRATHNNCLAPIKKKGKKNPERTLGHQVPTTYTERDQEKIEVQLKLNFRSRT
ncbi:hypothetical protein SLS57_009876 [Botryosphaeria dothidea]